MLDLSNSESRRARLLIEALDEHEITWKEFACAIQPLPAEVLQVVALVMASGWDQFPDRMRRLWKARLLCREAAASHRNLC